MQTSPHSSAPQPGLRAGLVTAVTPLKVINSCQAHRVPPPGAGGPALLQVGVSVVVICLFDDALLPARQLKSKQHLRSNLTQQQLKE